jgi:iron only hydrogenase large subunit-like protein/ferredoxin
MTIMDVNILVNNKKLTAKQGETILNVLSRNGIKVPTLCHMNEFSATGSCRLCVVEIVGKKELVPSCAFPVEDTMEIFTHSPRVINARKSIVELLLANHPDDCLYCERNQHCELQNLALELNIRERRYFGRKKPRSMDKSSPAIEKDDSKCILCGRCIRVCDERIQASAIDFSGRGVNTRVDTVMSKGLNYSSCIACGQCVLVCPSGALSTKSALTPVLDAMNNPNTKILIELAPVVGYSLAEKMGFKQGKDITGLLIAGLKASGVENVFDLAWAGDFYLAETAKRMLNSAKPIIVTTCPAVRKYIEQFYPEALNFLNPLKTPQQIMGALLKNKYILDKQLDVNDVFVVSIGPCTAAKAEATRIDTMSNGIPDVDAVLTTAELLRLLKLTGIDLHNIDPARFDPPFHVSSSSGSLYHISGGLTEGLYRQLHFLKTGQLPVHSKISELRFIKPDKKIEFQIAEKQYSARVVSGIQNIRAYLEKMIAGEFKEDILDVSACLSGCMGGGGQPFSQNFEDNSKLLLRSLYKSDDESGTKSPNQNPLAMEFLESIDDEGNRNLRTQLYHKKAE